MLKRASRLPSAEFRAGNYRIVGTPYFSLRSRMNGGTRNRIGVVVGGAVHKSAARRNFWKRQAKAALSTLPPSGKDLLVIFSPKVNTLTKDQFKKTIIAATKK